MSKELFNLLCKNFKNRYPNSDVPNDFYTEFVSYVYLVGALDGAHDPDVVEAACQKLSHDTQNVEAS